MRILHLIPNLSGGGAERQLSYIAPELARLGHEVHIAYSEDGPLKPDLFGVNLHHLRVRSSYDPSLLLQIISLSRKLRPDLVHTWILQMDILGGIAAKINRVPWILREPSSVKAYTTNWKQKMRICVGSGASAIVSNSRGGNEYWKSVLPESRRYIVRNALPLQIIEETICRSPTRLPDPGSPFILSAGRLAADKSADKNLAALLRSMQRVLKEKQVNCILCGEGSQRTDLELLSRVMGLDGHVSFLGYLPAASLWGLMKKASLFISLSMYEGCSNTIMEAIACDCPVIVSDIPAHREILDKDSAIFVDPNDLQQVAKSIIQVISDERGSRIRSDNAKRSIKGWPISRVASDWENVYKEVIGSSVARSRSVVP